VKPSGILPHAVLLFLIWVLVLQAPSTLLVGIAWGLVALYALDLLWLQANIPALRVQRRFPSRAYTDDTILLQTSIRNSGALPVLSATLTDAIPQEFISDRPSPTAISLGPFGAGVLTRSFTCTKRGYYRIGPLSLAVVDPLGLSTRSVDVVEPQPLIVYPRVVPLRRLGLPAPAALAVLPSRTRLVEDPSRLTGIRPYLPTDSLRRVHWTATARTGSLMVKEFAFGVSRSTMICLDLGRSHYPARDRAYATELAIEVAASIAHHAVTRDRLEVGLRVAGRDPLLGEAATCRVAPASDRHTLMTILELLARVQTTPSDTFLTTLRNEARRLPWGSTVVVITGPSTADLRGASLDMRRAGLLVLVVAVSRETVPAMVHSVPVRRVWSTGDLAAGALGARS
jgi:uncharacterized repeat protein (TIGR01451 family)